MGTTLSGARIVTANSDPNPGAKPASGSDGTYTWSVVGQRGSLITLSVSDAALSNASCSANDVSADASRVSNSAGYLQVSASFTGSSDQNNWTIKANSKGNTALTFVKGNGGGH